MGITERRLYVRARVAASATVWIRGTCRGSYIVENLSLGGVFLSGGPAIQPGTEVKLIVQLPQGLAEAKGKILRSEAQLRDHTLAIAFEPLTRAARIAIGTAVAAALEAATLDIQERPEPTVLVVDDSVLAREALTRDIRMAGCEVASFSTSLDAVSFLHRPDARIRVAVVDLIGTPDANDLLRFLAEDRPGIRRVAMSDHGRPPPDELARMGLPIDAVLAKPWDAEMLAQVILSSP